VLNDLPLESQSDLPPIAPLGATTTYEPDTNDVSLTMAFLRLAVATMDKAALAEWLRARVRQV
jgi:hypothetical protein